MKITEDQKVSIAIMSIFVILSLQSVVILIINANDNLIDGGLVVSKVLVGLFFLYALPIVFKRIAVKFIFIYIFALFVFFIHFLIFPENNIYMRDIFFAFFFICMPSFVFTLSIKDLSVLYLTMKRASYMVLLTGLLVVGFIFAGKIKIDTYNMSFSYNMLLPAIMSLDSFLNKRSLKSIILAMLSILIILVYGARGPLLCIFVFIFLRTFKLTKVSYKAIAFYFMVILGGITLFIYKDNILMWLNDILINIGMSSRSLTLFMKEEVSLSGRDTLYIEVVQALLNSPLLGIGLGGDRRLVGGYVHNIFIEILADFGFIIGLVIIVSLLILIVKSLLLTKDKNKYSIVTIWLSVGFIHYMVSSSYLTTSTFWIFLGILLSKNSTKIVYR